MSHAVFISYSNKDKPIADAICANLESTGVRCWIAPRDIAPGEDWPTAITRAISQSRIMVLVFSASSNSSEDVGRELMLAATNKLVIIPFKIDNIEPEPGKQYYLARMHWLDAINPPTQEQINLLINRVKALIPFREPSPIENARIDQSLPGKAKPGPYPPQPAPEKRATGVRFLWIPATLVLLGLLGWVILTFVLHYLPAPLAKRATATANATATVTPPEPATRTATPNPVMPAPLDWNVSVSDSFTSNTNGWPVIDNSNDGCSILNLNIQSDVLLWTIDALPGNFCGYVYNPRIPSVSDFDASLDINGSAGIGKSDYGIGFRIIDADNYYSFVINQASQSYEIRRILNNSWSRLVDWKYDSVIKPDNYNHLTVSARGSVFYFFINDILMDTVEDSEFSSGSIGVVSEIFNGGKASISYDNFVLHGIR